MNLLFSKMLCSVVEKSFIMISEQICLLTPSPGSLEKEKEEKLYMKFGKNIDPQAYQKFV